MNKIINKNRYNTDSARNLGTWSNGKGYVENLYVTKTGNYFRHYVGSSQEPTEDIEALTYKGAKAWADKHLTKDEYKAIFEGEPEKTVSGTVELLRITLPIEMVKELREKKEVTGANVSWQIKKALLNAGYCKKKR